MQYQENLSVAEIYQQALDTEFDGEEIKADNEHLVSLLLTDAVKFANKHNDGPLEIAIKAFLSEFKRFNDTVNNSSKVQTVQIAQGQIYFPGRGKNPPKGFGDSKKRGRGRPPKGQ